MQVTELPLDQLQAHPSQFLFHDLGGTEWDELVKDVRERGIQQPITVSTRTGEAVIVDGHQRARAAREAGLGSVPAVEARFDDERQETLALVMANVRRRHLNREERRQVIAQMLKLYPEKSNRQHGDSLGVSHNTVKAEREALESLGQIDQVERVTTSDGKSRPVTQAPSKPKPQLIPVTPEIPRVSERPVQPLMPVIASPPPGPAPVEPPMEVYAAPSPPLVSEIEELEPWQVDHTTVIDLTPTPFEQHLQEIGYEEARSFETCAQRAISALAALNHYSSTDLVQIAQSTAGRGLYAPMRIRRLRELLEELQAKVRPDEETSRRTIDAEAVS